MSKIIYGVLAFYFSFVNVYSQDVIDNEEKYKLLALHALFSEGLNRTEAVINSETLTKFLLTRIEIVEIKQEDFNDYIFLHIKPIELNTEEEYDPSLPVIWNSCDGYILAIEKWSNYVFKLKGFKINEFHAFIRNFNNKSIKQNKKEFANSYKVEGLDFECLFESLKINKTSYDLKKLSCIYETCFKVFSTH